MLESAIFQIKNDIQFEALALEVFKFQYNQNRTYRSFCNHLKIKVEQVDTVKKIPFLPIQLFKYHTILADGMQAKCSFKSSGTSGQEHSWHHVAKINLYRESFTKAFESYFGNPENFAILALLPSYQEQGNSSLVFMVQELIAMSKHPQSGFYLNQTEELITTLKQLEAAKQPTILFGVSYALLDLIEKHDLSCQYTKIVETGGMKGRRKELVKTELHQKLRSGFGTDQIYSEYGMTELLSQAYANSPQTFLTPPWMKVLIRDTEDALRIINNRSGGINIIDLANLYSCAFIATQDLGKLNKDGSFEILGRFDESDIRGCNLMVF